MRGILLQIRCFERELSKSSKKVNLIFLSNRMSSVCHSYITRMYSYDIRMSLVCTRMPSVCHSCTRMSSVCHSYVLLCHVLVCHSYVTRLWFYHEPLKNVLKLTILSYHHETDHVTTILSYWIWGKDQSTTKCMELNRDLTEKKLLYIHWIMLRKIHKFYDMTNFISVKILL